MVVQLKNTIIILLRKSPYTVAKKYALEQVLDIERYDDRDARWLGIEPHAHKWVAAVYYTIFGREVPDPGYTRAVRDLHDMVEKTEETIDIGQPQYLAEAFAAIEDAVGADIMTTTEMIMYASHYKGKDWKSLGDNIILARRTTHNSLEDLDHVVASTTYYAWPEFERESNGRLIANSVLFVRRVLHEMSRILKIPNSSRWYLDPDEVMNRVEDFMVTMILRRILLSYKSEWKTAFQIAKKR